VEDGGQSAALFNHPAAQMATPAARARRGLIIVANKRHPRYSVSGNCSFFMKISNSLGGLLVTAALLAAAAPGLAPAQILIVTTTGAGAATIGSYEAASGAVINTDLIPGEYSYGVVASGNTLYVGLPAGVATYNATTGALLNRNFISWGTPNAATGLALDGNGNLYALIQNASTVGKYNATTGATINASFITGLFIPGLAIAADSGGNVFVGDRFNVKKFDASGALLSGNFVSTPLYTTNGLAVDDNDHLFVSGNISTIGEYDAVTGATINSAFITGLGAIPAGLALDNGYLYVANNGSAGYVGKYDASTGAAVDAILTPNNFAFPFAITIAPVPEPAATAAVGGLAALGLALWRGRARRKSSPRGKRSDFKFEN
jgi:hypothetical protein